MDKSKDRVTAQRETLASRRSKNSLDFEKSNLPSVKLPDVKATIFAPA